jgi:hypothetical protein
MKNEEKGLKALTVVINGREHTVVQKELSFAELVQLAFSRPPSGANAAFTVTYRRGQGEKPEGSLIEGQSVKLKDGMIFNVTFTDKS